jgi:tetratricopeptide (TPR) repeat protein
MQSLFTFDGLREIILGVFASFVTGTFLAVAGWIAVRSGFGKIHRNAQRHLRQGQVLQTAGDFVRAREEFETSIRLLREHPTPALLAEAYLRLGDTDLATHNWEGAVEHFKRYRELASKRAKIPEDLICLRIGRAHLGMGNVDEAFRFLDDARQLQERVSQNPLLGETYVRLAETEARRKRPDAAREHFLRAINVQERLRDRRAEAGSRVGLAEMYAAMGDHQSARGQYTTAAQLYRTAGDSGTASLIDAKVSQIAVA